MSLSKIFCGKKKCSNWSYISVLLLLLMIFLISVSSINIQKANKDTCDIIMVKTMTVISIATSITLLYILYHYLKKQYYIKFMSIRFSPISIYLLSVLIYNMYNLYLMKKENCDPSDIKHIKNSNILSLVMYIMTLWFILNNDKTLEKKFK